MTHRPSEEESRRHEVENAVLGYLQRRPGAADTIDGIVGWWLPQQRYEIERQRIEHVLSNLVARGKLRCEELPGGVILYALSEPREPYTH
ncbi:hypothetical protein DWU98_11195 [Dyella monticola]|uniref:DUF3253 domain-containing protein n=1 Tax=Dyella monticola TaxID=1927958 RepID=A0A370WYA1_9GAMM|nr:hypothetical protein [Dyella monticola]RDS81109.1 hypothetical protein DWU98_11195 [Dyella monticola]